MTKMYYFGPLNESGHFLFRENGQKVGSWMMSDIGIPWKGEEIDGPLQPGHPDPADRLQRRTRPMCEGEALIHYKDGWTALSIWDFSVDTRPGCSSTYISKGTFTFEQMVELAKAHFTERWNKMRFEVRLADATRT